MRCYRIDPTIHPACGFGYWCQCAGLAIEIWYVVSGAGCAATTNRGTEKNIHETKANIAE